MVQMPSVDINKEEKQRQKKPPTKAVVFCIALAGIY